METNSSNEWLDPRNWGPIVAGFIVALTTWLRRNKKKKPLSDTNGNILIRDVVRDSQAVADGAVIREIAQRDKAQLRADELQARLFNAQNEVINLNLEIVRHKSRILDLEREVEDLKESSAG